jgi:predicted N-acetyltransferase YhbS
MSIEIRGVREEEYPQLLAMLPRVMSAPRTYFAACYRHDPGARPEQSRVVLVDGEIVSHIRLYDRWQRVGGVPIHVGCVGDVCTLPEHRRRGYCRALLEDALAYWDTHDTDLSMIVSGVGVYERCGWAPFPEMAYRAPAVDLSERVVEHGARSSEHEARDAAGPHAVVPLRAPCSALRAASAARRAVYVQISVVGSPFGRWTSWERPLPKST